MILVEEIVTVHSQAAHMNLKWAAATLSS